MSFGSGVPGRAASLWWAILLPLALVVSAGLPATVAAGAIGAPPGPTGPGPSASLGSPGIGPGTAAASIGIPNTVAPALSPSQSGSSTIPFGNLQTSFAESPNPGTLNSHEVAPGGSVSEDPAVAYDTVSAEPIENVYEPLITYNGSTIAGTLASAYVPVLATCVPGTVQCAEDYPTFAPSNLGAGNSESDLITYHDGTPFAYTYPIDPTARFYNASFGVSWPVYPSDVVFSVARTAAFADLPFEERYNGWILTQALVPGFGSLINGANPGWNGRIDFPLNNTGYNVLASMLVNDSEYCPETAANGCVTFILNGSQSNWPFFQELVANSLGGSIVSCGAFTAAGAGVPGFARSSAPHGMGPCLLPGGAHATTDASFQAALTTLDSNAAVANNLTSWNSFEELALNYPSPQPGAQWGMTGSGPYYLSGLSIGTSYSLNFNPDYAQPAGCAGLDGFHGYPDAYCDPAADSGGVCASETNAPNAPYACAVNVFWDDTDGSGYSALESGSTDFAGLYPTHTNELVGLATTDTISCTSTGNSCGAPWNGQNKVNIGYTGTISNFALMPNFEYNLTAYQNDFPEFPNPAGLNFMSFNPCDPSNPHYSRCGTFPTSFFFSGQAVRALLSLAYPYNEIQTTVFEQTSGSTTITYQATAGGPIPSGMDPYYTNGVPFPFLQNGGVPDNNSADNGSAAWWFDAGAAFGAFSWAAYPGKADPSAYDPWYDPDLASCLNTTCTFPIDSQLGDPTEDQSIDDAIAEIQTITWAGGGANHYAVAPFRVDVNFGQGQSGYEISGNTANSYYFLGWAPDFPDPTDYVPTYIGPDGAIGGMNSYAAILAQPQFNTTGCPDSAGSYANLLYWGSVRDIPEGCQSVAYNLTVEFDNLAGVQNAGGVRTAYYEDIENISTYLNLETWQGQTDGVLTAAPWISMGSLNTNPTIGGGGDQLYYEIKYAAPLALREVGLPETSAWGIRVGALDFNTTASSELVGAANGPNSWSVDEVPAGYALERTSPEISDPLTLATTGLSVVLVFAHDSTVTVAESGLPVGTNWSVTLTAPRDYAVFAPNVGSDTVSPTGPNQVVFAGIVAGYWAYKVSGTPSTALADYRTSPITVLSGVHGAQLIVPDTADPVSTALTFSLATSIYSFSETHLSAHQTWTVTMSGTESNGQTFSASVTTARAWIYFHLPDGSYTYTVTTSGSQTATPATGSFLLGSVEPWYAPSAASSSPPNLHTAVGF